MPIKVTATYAPKTINIAQSVASAIVPIGRQLDDLAPKVAKNSDDLIGNINAVKRTEEAVFEQAQKFGTYDEKLIAEANRIRKNEVNIGRNQATIDTVDGKAGRALGQAGEALGKAADLFDRVSNIFSLVATLGTAARMEFIYNELKGVDADLQRQISEVQDRLNNAFERIQNNESDIDYLEGELMGIANSLEFIKNQNRGILTNTSSLLSGQNTISNKQDSMSSKINLIKEDTEVIRNVVPQIDDNVISAIKQKVCEALNSDCWENINGGDELDLSTIEQKLNDIGSSLENVLNQLGFPFNCQTNFIANGQYDSVAEALFSVVCRGGSGGSNAIEELLEEKDRTDEILAAIEEIDPNVALPESWQVKVGIDRPQLVILYGETLGGGKVGRSRSPLTIPHWNGNQNWLLLPRWRKGNTQARLILKDNSRVYLYAHSEGEAAAAIKKVIKFIKPGMIDNKKPFIGKANIDIKDMVVEPCTAKFYEKGQLTEIPDFYQIRNG